jgi:two-component system NtrC family sensor kinase
MKPIEKLKYLSISSRISILLGVIILLTMGVFSTFSLMKQQEDSIESINHNAKQLSRTIEKILRFSMLKNRRQEISMAVKNIIGSEGIKSARILDHKGEIRFSSNQSEVGKFIGANNQLCLSCHDQKSKRTKGRIENFENFRISKDDYIIYNSLPIYNSPGCYNEDCHSTPVHTGKIEKEALPEGRSTAGKTDNDFPIEVSNISSPHDSSQTILGFIDFQISIEKIISNLETTRTQLIFLTLLFALLASVIMYFLIRYFIGKPVKNLVDGTMRVAQGDFKHEIPPGKAELGLLSESFNLMQKQLIATQTQLIESEKLASIGKLADEIANEINNPLTGIIIYSEALLEESNLDINKKKDYETILSEALKIRESLKNVLSIAQPGKPNFQKTKIDQIIKHTVSVVERFSNFRNIQIVSGISRFLPEITADPVLLEQAFLNLILNSSELMDNGGILNISALYNDESEELEIIFTDTGKRIPEKIIQEVFNPATNSGLNFSGKEGISFSVCKNIVEIHRGTIDVNSTDSGNTVTIKLPEN